MATSPLGANDGASGNIAVDSAAHFTVNGDLTMAEVFGATAGVAVTGAGSTLSASNMHVGGSSTEQGGLALVHVEDLGQLFVANTLNLWGGGSLHVDGGAVTVGDGTTPAAPDFVRVNAPGKLSGAGQVIGNVLNAGGIVAPGNSPGTLTIDGDFTQLAAGTLQFELAGTGAGSQFDQLSVTGAVALAGTVDVGLIDDFTPSPGDLFPIIAAGGVSGAFTNGSLPALTGANWQIEYSTTSVLLRVVISGDYNHNGKVDAADYTVWRNSLGQAGVGLAADGNGDGHITPADYAVWKAHYGQVAPAAGSSNSADRTAVPEPNARFLLIVAAMALALCRSVRGTRRVP